MWQIDIIGDHGIRFNYDNKVTRNITQAWRDGLCEEQRLICGISDTNAYGPVLFFR